MTSPPTAPEAAPALPPATRDYFEKPALAPLWAAARERLERNGVAVTSSAVHVDLDEEGRSLLAGVLGTPVVHHQGRGTAVRLDVLDTALRRSAASCGIVGVLTVLGGPIVDRKAARAEKATRSADLWSHVEHALARHGLAGAPWAGPWLSDLRRSGILTRAGADAATAASEACAVLAVLNEQLPLTDTAESLAAQLPAAPRFELGELATRCTSTAHGLDTGATTASLVLRALALATDEPMPATSAAARSVWATVGVATDEVSGTLLVWGLRPPGDGSWARMMQERAELGLVSHVTMQEWRQAAGTEPWVMAGDVVQVCENPQVLQAAARARMPRPVLCVSGNPATVALAVLDALVAAGSQVRYHGDFDVEGVKIAARLSARGVTPWRMNGADYREAVRAVGGREVLGLSGTVPATPWDPDLATEMNRAGVAVHEEALLEVLLAEMRAAQDS